MNFITRVINKIVLEFHKRTNKLFGPIRIKKVNTPSFTVISNNCWAGSLYRWFALPYCTPTIGLYFYADDYIKFLGNLDYYLSLDFEEITAEQSKHRESLFSKHEENAPIGKLDDIEVIFLHYKTFTEAATAWNRRKQRIRKDYLYIKMSEMNECTPELIEQFERLPYKNKFIFVTRNYDIKSQVIHKDWQKEPQIKDDTSWFNKYINVTGFLNGQSQ